MIDTWAYVALAIVWVLGGLLIALSAGYDAPERDAAGDAGVALVIAAWPLVAVSMVVAVCVALIGAVLLLPFWAAMAVGRIIKRGLS